MTVRDYIFLLLGLIVLSVLALAFFTYFGLLLWEELNDG